MKIASLTLICAVLLPPLPGQAREETAPDMEMLEFLGSYETARGKPIDPRAFTETPRKAVGQEQPPAAKKDGKQRPAADKRDRKDRYEEK